MWYPADRCSPAAEPLAFGGPPSLVVEVLPPSTRSFDPIRKRGDYEHVEIGEVWFVDPRERNVVVCQRLEPAGCFTDHELGAGDTVTSPLLDGFAVVVDELFRR